MNLLLNRILSWCLIEITFDGTIILGRRLHNIMVFGPTAFFIGHMTIDLRKEKAEHLAAEVKGFKKQLVSLLSKPLSSGNVGTGTPRMKIRMAKRLKLILFQLITIMYFGYLILTQ